MPTVPARDNLIPRRRGWRPDEIANSFLLPDERVLLNEHKSLRAWMLGQLPLILLAILLVAVVQAVDVDGAAMIGSIAVVAVVALFLYRAVEAFYTRYVMTEMRVLRVSGVLNRNAEFIPWLKVTDVSRSETLLQWLVGSATIRIESANERSAFREMSDVHEPDRFYRKLVEKVAEVNLDRRRGRPG